MTVAATPEYVRFDEDGWLPLTRKTDQWWVISRRHGYTLGKVKWNGGWRQYVFVPESDTVWSAGCLVAIAEFCAERTAEYRKKAA